MYKMAVHVVSDCSLIVCKLVFYCLMPPRGFSQHFTLWFITQIQKSMYKSTLQYAPSQWETSLQINAVSHRLGAYRARFYLDSYYMVYMGFLFILSALSRPRWVCGFTSAYCNATIMYREWGCGNPIECCKKCDNVIEIDTMACHAIYTPH